MQYEIKRVQTWGQGMDFTFQMKESWLNGAGRETNEYNCAHVTAVYSRDYLMSNFNRETVHKLCLKLRETRNLSNNTLNKVISCISTVLKTCAEHGVINHELGDRRFTRFEQTEARILFFDETEFMRVYETAQELGQSKLADLILFAYLTGVRQSEVLKLRVRHVVLKDNLIWIGGEPQFGNINKNKMEGGRPVPISSRLMPTLVKRLEKFTDPDEFLWKTDFKNGDSIRNRLYKVYAALGLPHRQKSRAMSYCFHTFRHSFISMHVRSGTKLAAVQRLAGHSDIQQTMKYTHLKTDDLLEATAAVDQQCGWGDLNSQAQRTHVPETCASTNSATSAGDVGCLSDANDSTGSPATSIVDQLSEILLSDKPAKLQAVLLKALRTKAPKDELDLVNDALMALV